MFFTRKIDKFTQNPDSMEKIPTGSKILDNLLNDGYETDIITTIYGPAGSGKTVLCILCAAGVARKGKKIFSLFLKTKCILKDCNQ